MEDSKLENNSNDCDIMLLEHFLRSRQIPETIIDYFKKENIDGESLLSMEEDDLKKHIPKCGDRIAILNFCKRTARSNKQSLIEKLKSKMESKEKGSKRKRPQKFNEQQHTKKPTRSIEIGWLCADKTNKDYKQVRAKFGGGTRRISISKNFKCSDILIIAKELFFPDGVSPKGSLSLFDCELLDFKSHALCEDLTVQEMYDLTAVKTMRCYLATKYKIDVLTDDEEYIPATITSQCTSESTAINNEYQYLVNSILDGLDHDANKIASEISNHSPICMLQDNSIIEEMERSSEQLATENIHQTFEDVVKTLQEPINNEESNTFNVFREEIFTCCVRAMRRQSFSPYNKIFVKFSDMEGTSEGAIDEGGPTRELFRLVINFIKEGPMFTGSYKKHLSLNAQALKNNHYYEAGRIIALSLVHGGPAPHFFSECLFRLITGQVENALPTLNDVGEDIKSALIQLENTESLSEAQNVITDTSIFTIAGYNFIYNFQDKSDIIQGTLKFYVINIIQEALAQFIDGLKTCNVHEYMVKFPDLFMSPMCDDVGIITAEDLERLFEVKYSTIGSNTRKVENKVITYFRDYLLECEANSNRQGECGSEEKISLVDILIFATGANHIPPLGFPLSPQITFLHDDSSPYPKANTCGLVLKLPVTHKSYEEFISALNFAFGNCNSFGFA
ncbi:unnamed protein product [Phaedon cochleariae]|uniref:HECT-type E3 ubiquitin transferase n=1 Tax=Phaedon cochleariae TaxID=80249 RepID=A0A9N9SI62_PHACE|nr:unnamed protein product [Phaedon cochleariae]